MEKPEEMKSNGFKILFFFLFFAISVNAVYAQTQSSGSTYNDPFNSGSSSSSSTSRNNTPSTGTQPSTFGNVTPMDNNPGGDPSGGGTGGPGDVHDVNVPFDGGLTLLLTLGIAQGFKRSSKQRRKLKVS